MRILFGQLYILSTILFCFLKSFDDNSFPHAINYQFLIWTVFLLAIAISTWWFPKPSFVIIWLYYMMTAYYRCVIWDNENALFLLWDMMYAIVVGGAIWGTFSKNGIASNKKLLRDLMYG